MNQPKAIVTAEHSVTAYSGPLPSAAEFERYEKSTPGAGNKLLEMADREALARQNNDAKALDESIKITRSGQYFAFAIVFFALAIILVSIIIDRPMVSSIVPAIVACTGIAAIFIDRKR